MKSMCFKNLIAYKLTEPFALSAEELATRLEEYRYSPCMPEQLESTGFVGALPLKTHTDLTFENSGAIMVRSLHEYKIIPPASLRAMVDEKVSVIESEQNRSVYSTERKQITENTVFEMARHAFSRHVVTTAYIDVNAGYLYIDAGSFKQAEMFTCMLRDAVGSLPIIPITKNLIHPHLTNWVWDWNLCPFELNDYVRFRSLSEPPEGIVTAKKEVLDQSYISNILNEGRVVSQLGVSIPDTLSFVIDESSRILRLKFNPELFVDEDPEDGSKDLIASGFIVVNQLRKLVKQLVSLFESEDVDDANSRKDSSNE